MREPSGTGSDLVRPAEPGHEAHRVTYVELFFDLIFVFAVTQISHALIEHQDIGTLVETLILTLAVWWVWVDTAWATNWLNPDNALVRAMMFALMLLGLLMSSAIPEAFGAKGLLFALCLTAAQVGRSIFAAAAFRRTRPDNAANFLRISVWCAFAGVFWILGAFAPDESRVWVWLVALGIELGGPRARFWIPVLGSSDIGTWDVSGEHMAERVSLFLIIVLGESIIVTGTVFGTQDVVWTSFLGVLAAFASTIVMWLLYFNHGERGGSRYISSATERGLIAQIAYTYIPFLLVTGILLTAVADGIVLHDPLGPGHDDGASGASDPWTAALICGASVFYLIGNLLFKRSVGMPWQVSHLVGAVVLVTLAFAYPVLTPLGLSWLANAVLVAVVVADDLSFRRSPSTSTS